jgi:hypothetical protein
MQVFFLILLAFLHYLNVKNYNSRATEVAAILINRKLYKLKNQPEG